MNNTIIINKKKLSKNIKIRRVKSLPSSKDLVDDGSSIELEIAEKMHVAIISKVSKIRGMCSYKVSSTSEIMSNKFVEVTYNTSKCSNTIKWSYVNKNYIKETITIKNKLQIKYYQIHDHRFKCVTI